MKEAKIVPCLWYDDEAEEAARFYASIFKRSKVGDVVRYGPGMPKPEGSVLTVRFWLEGQEFLALNGGPQFPFTEAVSLIVNVDDQAELDAMWEKLSKGGTKVQCGWLKDRYGLSWQITPRIVSEMLTDPDPARVDRVMQAILKMKKLDIAKLKRAYGASSRVRR